MPAKFHKKMDKKIISRLAPTPSGYLHLGNAFNFILTWALVKRAGGLLWLRIDDMDRERCRPEYIDDIFWAIDWLGLDFDLGPQNSADFSRHYSQQDKTEYYRSKLPQMGGLYPCECSKKAIFNKYQSNLYPGDCRKKGLVLDFKKHCLRHWVEDKKLLASFGDIIVWRRLNMPGYHLVALIEDEDMQINLIVRGEDLEKSSTLHTYLAQRMHLKYFPDVSFIHHPLIFDEKGEKLTKSLGAFSLKDGYESARGPDKIFQEVAAILKMEDSKGIRNAQDFLNRFQDFSLQKEFC